MAANPYPNLGWNPVTGMPGEVSALQQKEPEKFNAMVTFLSQLK